MSSRVEFAFLEAKPATAASKVIEMRSTAIEKSELVLRGLEECRGITRRYGTSFYFATQFFPRETREGIYAVYAFARIPDEIVDDPGTTTRSERVARLEEWRQ